MPREILMGIEQEMPLMTTAGRRGALAEDVALPELIRIAQRRLPHLPGPGRGDLFLGNSMRLYIDCQKLEAAGPDCTHPDQLVCYAAAAERIVAALAAKLQRRHGLKDAALYRCSVSYGNSSTWGSSHESFLTRSPPAQLAPDLLPFLASRVVTAGAGGFVPGTTGGCSFTLSPRATYLKAAVSPSSTGSGSRGLFHTKDEPHAAAGYHRLHLLAGEALCSHRAVWLRAASTAAVVAMADGGLRPGRGVELRDPVGALCAFAADPTCKARAETTDGQLVSAIDIQRHYLRLTRENLSAPCMPPFAVECVDPWQEVLDRLERGAPHDPPMLDWIIKYKVFSNHLDRNGFSWPLLRRSQGCATLLNHCVSKVLGDKQRPGVPAEQEMGQAAEASPNFRTVMTLLRPHMSARGVQLDAQLPQYFRLRQELFALDFQFGRCGAAGIFNHLDRAGVLSHRVANVSDADILRAQTEPPPFGRADLRGKAIQALHGRDGGCGSADWTAVRDGRKRLFLDLRDPFVSSAAWFADQSPLAVQLGDASSDCPF